LPESDFDSPTPETLALIHVEVSTALKLQFKRHDLLTSRAQQVVTFGGVIVGISSVFAHRAFNAATPSFLSRSPSPPSSFLF
jgi:hypothetical protein